MQWIIHAQSEVEGEGQQGCGWQEEEACAATPRVARKQAMNLNPTKDEDGEGGGDAEKHRISMQWGRVADAWSSYGNSSLRWRFDFNA